MHTTRHDITSACPRIPHALFEQTVRHLPDLAGHTPPCLRKQILAQSAMCRAASSCASIRCSPVNSNPSPVFPAPLASHPMPPFCPRNFTGRGRNCNRLAQPRLCTSMRARTFGGQSASGIKVDWSRCYLPVLSMFQYSGVMWLRLAGCQLQTPGLIGPNGEG